MLKVAKPDDAAAALPAALTAHILQLVPQKQRLTQCSTVCQAWAAAATAATVHVQLEELTAGSLPLFQAWLNQHAGQLLRLQLSLNLGYAARKLQLPLHKLTQLQQLRLRNLQLQLPGEGDSVTDQEVGSPGVPLISPTSGSSRESAPAAGAGHVAATTLLRSLQQLELTDCQLASINSLLRLAQAPQLTSLRLFRVDLATPKFSSKVLYRDSAEAAGVQAVAQAMPDLLRQLPRLSVLEVPGMPLTDAALQQVAVMRGLQEFHLVHRKHVPMCNLSLLPSSVTRLLVEGVDGNGPSLPQQLPQLTSLLHLDLQKCRLPPSVLRCMPQLRHLHLASCVLLPAAPPGQVETEGTAALLDALLHLTRLQHLHLALDRLDTENIVPRRFSALTASSQLTYLSLEPFDEAPLPLHSVHHMFPKGTRMPLLEHLRISPELLGGEDDPEDLPCMDNDDLIDLCRCCCNLQWLDIAYAVHPGADLSVLAQLPKSCTALLVGGAAFTDAAAPVLAKLTQLEYLRWTGSPGFTDAGLEQLTALDLGRLHVQGSSLSAVVSKQGDRGTLTLEYEDRGGGSVWEQIDALCEASPVCAPVRAAKYKATISRLQEDNSSLRTQLRCSRIQARKFQRQLAAAVAAQQLEEAPAALQAAADQEQKQAQS